MSHRSGCGCGKCIDFSQPKRSTSCDSDESSESIRVFETRRGNTVIIDEQIFRVDGITPANITGWLIWFSVKYYLADPDGRAIVADRSDAVGTGITFTFPTNGQIEIKIPAGKTSAFPDANVDLHYDVQAKDPVTGNVFTVDVGIIRVKPGVTRAIV